MKSHQPIVFPRDHGSHSAIIEWWYFNGQLRSHDGHEYSFMDCLFKADLKKVNIPILKKLPIPKVLGTSPYVFFAHSVVSDISAQKNYKDIQNISLVSRDSFKRPLFFVNYINPFIVRGFANNEMAEIASDHFHIKTEHIDLNLVSKKIPLLEGGDGYISVCGRESYYYSLTDLEVVGQVYVDGEWIAVEGKAWMDHQWADVSYVKDRWSWFSVQLDDGTDMMCVEYGSGENKEYLVDIIDNNGHMEHYKNIILTPGTEIWRSKKTKTEYPMSWNIEVPEANIKLTTYSIMSDQEMIFGDINYWEGPLKVNGAVKNKKVNGIGFMELVGYPSKYNYLMLLGKELNKNFWERWR